VPPAPEDEEPPADVVPPERVERERAEDVRDEDERAAGFLAVDDAGLRALEVVLDVDVFLAVDVAGLRAAVDDFRAVDVAGLRAVVELLAVDAEPPREPTSSAETRLASPSISLRRPFSSSATRSSSTSRMRFAAAVTSFARPRVDLAPSADALKVRSTAARTASTASAAPAAALSFLPFFFESFLAMAARS
jgi:hypothetical protein